MKINTLKNIKLPPFVPNLLSGSLSSYGPLIGSIALGVLIVLFVTLPRLTSLPSTQRELSQKNNQLLIYRDKNIKLADLLGHQEVLQSDLDLVDSAITDKENVPELLAQIEKIASESGVSVRSLHFGLKTTAMPGTQVSKSKYQTIYLQTEAEGSYANIQSFLINLERGSRLTFVDSLRFSQEGLRETSRLRASLTLEAFYAVLPEKLSPERAVTLNLGSPKLNKVLEFLKPLKIYRVDISSGGAGKLNPFE